ncbi:PKD domain-containing protein [Ferruginibacter lapsinanis]|uniref:PKD domain-containing protein n=1 Tax=Ferruginibacter lapsinanis TaxID=563172 RepID=UPI001E467DE6|nr:PKD domain-containing protein [Ferruginibacter lapsinanis]UEG51228.1 PKD domain-containing protein [Ferruginibacter lapsinanis]
MNCILSSVDIDSNKKIQQNIFLPPVNTSIQGNAIVPSSLGSKVKLKTIFFCLTILCLSIKIVAQPIANFSANVISGCVPVLVKFTDQSTGNPKEWKWNLGNGTHSNLQNPSATYFNPGKYTVKLTVKTGNNIDSIVKLQYITVYGAPLVNFNAAATVGCSPFTVNFSDASIAGPESISTREWDFGDGTLSSQQNPSHTYTLKGNYNVTLKITNINGCIATSSKTNFIKTHTVKADFSTKTLATCTPNKILFQNLSSGTGTISYYWSFGDGTTSTISSPTHTFTNSGNYSVKLITSNQYGCTDSIVKNLQVLDAVSAQFSGDNLESCRPPVLVHFNNKELVDNGYLWDFGDGSTSKFSNPTHEYKDTGTYTIKLIVKNNNGCSDSIKKINYIKINHPILTFNNLPDSGCQSLTKKLTVDILNKNMVSSYLWNFGDGTTSTEESPTHTFSKLGYQNISLISTSVNGCKDTAYMDNAIRVTTKPVANFSADIRNSCAKTAIQFTNLSTGGATSFEWNFGDFGVSNEKDPKHSYKDTGWMTVRLVAMNGGCTDTIVFKKYIYIKPAVSKFMGSMKCEEPYVRTFVNLSRNATRFLWDFGDGTTSTENSPAHTYPRNGDFDVTLFVWNDSTGCDHSSTKAAKILTTIPSFSASRTDACRDEKIYFTSPLDMSDVFNFSWNFGDGSKRIDTSSNKVWHIYKEPGLYTVTLTTTNILNCRDTLIKTNYINITAPKANFAITDTIVCVNSPALFDDNSSKGGNAVLQKWIWNYGDGVIDTLGNQSFIHAFKRAGKYPISLKLIDSKGCRDSLAIPSAIQIIKVDAKFSLSDTIACPNSPVKFTAPATNPGNTYLWDFGDGNTSTTQTPIHNYSNEGLYTVKLFVKNSNGCEDSSKIINAIRIARTVANFKMSDSFRTCPPLIIQFTNFSVNAREEYWDFGDNSSTNVHNPTHFYTYPGVYTATLYSKGPGGCIDTMQKKITVTGPRGTLTYDPLRSCKPYDVNFKISSTDAVSYIWDFDNGNTLANKDSIINYHYQDSGIFIPKIILIDNVGCKVPVAGKDTIVNVFAAPSFKFPNNIICTQTDINFTNTTITNDIILTYFWDFGDNTTSAEKNPIHQYKIPGLYYPTLTVTTRFGCSGQYQTPIPVKVVPSSGIEILSNGNGCTPLTAKLSGSSTEEVASFISWHWDMGNEKTSDLQTPPDQVYNTAGVYTITLTAINSNGCAKTVQKVIEAYATPVIKVSQDTLLCRGQAVTLHASGASKYSWLSNRGLIKDTTSSITTIPAVSTKYIVTGSSLEGCNANSSISVNVKQPLSITYSQPDKLCFGQAKRLEANGADNYEWSPAYGLSCTNTANPTAKPDSSITYRVIGSDETGCFKDTGYIKLTVYPMPTVEAGENKTVVVGQSVTIQPKISSDVTQVTWTPQTNVISSSNDLPALTVKPKETSQYTVEVKNRGGCKATDNVTVFVICNGTNVFMPNLFTPNRDGVNDIFYPRGTGLYKIKNLRIFSRWGETIFEKNNFNSNDASYGWDGTFKGQKLNSETFVYTIQIVCDNNEVLDLNGTVFLAN